MPQLDIRRNARTGDGIPVLQWRQELSKKKSIRVDFLQPKRTIERLSHVSCTRSIELTNMVSVLGASDEQGFKDMEEAVQVRCANRDLPTIKRDYGKDWDGLNESSPLDQWVKCGERV